MIQFDNNQFIYINLFNNLIIIIGIILKSSKSSNVFLTLSLITSLIFVKYNLIKPFNYYCSYIHTTIILNIMFYLVFFVIYLYSSIYDFNKIKDIVKAGYILIIIGSFNEIVFLLILLYKCNKFYKNQNQNQNQNISSFSSFSTCKS